MTDRVLIPLPGIGTLSLSREVYEAALLPLASFAPSPAVSEQLVTAKQIAAITSLPISCVYEYARMGRIPSVRAGRHMRFNQAEVLATLKKPGTASVGHG